MLSQVSPNITFTGLSANQSDETSVAIQVHIHLCLLRGLSDSGVPCNWESGKLFKSSGALSVCRHLLWGVVVPPSIFSSQPTREMPQERQQEMKRPWFCAGWIHWLSPPQAGHNHRWKKTLEKSSERTLPAHPACMHYYTNYHATL